MKNFTIITKGENKMAKAEIDVDITMVKVFVEIAKLCESMKIKPLNEFTDCWECKLDERWTITVNAHREPKICNDVEIAPFHCYVEFNGFPAGIFSPRGGSIAAGSEANEDNLIKAIRLKRLQVVFYPEKGGNGK